MTLLSELKDWLSVISVGGLIVTGVALNWLRGQFATKTELAEARAAAKTDLAELKAEHLKICVKVEVIEDRVAKIEGEMKHMPDKTAVHEMKLAMAEMSGQLGIMNERMKAVAATGDRLQEFLVDQASRRAA